MSQDVSTEEIAGRPEAPASDIYESLGSPAAVRKYFEENGYVVVRQLLPSSVCDRVVELFNQQVKPFDGFIYRQTSSLPERHQFDANGHMLNSIKHIQDMAPSDFSRFIDASMKALTHEALRASLYNLISEDSAVLVQSMFFEGNPVTPGHHDGYFLDTAEPGRLVAAWVALEDIAEGAGRFYVYPGSHRWSLPKNEGEFEITRNFGSYLKRIKELMASPGAECRAPALRKGDVLFWSSRTLHGSLETTHPEYSRLSMTAHYLPSSQDYVLFEKTKMTLNTRMFDNFPIHHPKDPRSLFNQLQMLGLRFAPGLAKGARNAIIRYRMRQNR